MASISRKETIAALDPLRPAIAARSAIQELSHIWFDGEFAYATNGGMGIKVKFSSPFKCGIPGSLFLGLLNQAAADTLDFSFDDDVLKFKTGRSSVKLNTLPIEQKVWRYPEKSAGKPVASLKVTEGFIAALKRVFVLRPSGPKRMEHHAVCIFAFDGEMDIFVTDSKSLLVMPVPQSVTGTARKIALPREMAEQIAGQCKADPELKMFDDHFVVQANEKVTLYSNVFDTSEMLDLPTYADKFTDDTIAPPVKLPEGFSAALERAVLLAGAEEPVVTLSGSAKSLKLLGRYKFGRLDEDFTLVKAIPKATILLDAKTLLSVKDVDKLAISDGFANLRSDDGFMYIMSAKTSEAGVGTEAPAPDEAAEDVVPPARNTARKVVSKDRGERTELAPKKGKYRNTRDRVELDDDIPF
jgi:DNA polymerase III sliding clamp (beta) subunit (PCNA family)